MDLAQLIGGSGIINYRGLSLESQKGITIKAEVDTWDVAIDGISPMADQRVNANRFKIEVIPSGKWINPDRLFPYIKMPSGRWIIPVLNATVNATTEVITATKHCFYTGDRVMIGTRTGGTLPTSSPQVDNTTWYYVKVLTDDTFTLHTTRAGANAGSAQVTFTTAGTSVVIIAQYDLEIIGEDGDRITFHAAAITKQPKMRLTRTDTPFEKMEFTAFLRNGKRTDDTDSVYTIDSPGFTGWTASATDIITNAPWVSWADQQAVSAVNIATETLDFATAHGLSTTDVVYVGTTGTLPSATPALSTETNYYVRAVDVDTISLHPTSADATANTNAVNFTDTGSGTLFITKDNPPYTLMDTEVGVEIDSKQKLDMTDTDRDGTINARFLSTTWEANFIPTTLGVSDVLSMLKMQGTGATMGRSLNATSRPLNIFSNGIFVRVIGAAPQAGQLAWNMKDDRARELTLVATRSVVNGTLSDVGYVGTTFPS